MKWFGMMTVAVLLTVACARQTGVIQPDAESGLLLTGNIEGAVLVIDGSRVGQIDQIGEMFDYKDGEAVQFSLEPGNHRLEVYQRGEIRVRRQVYLNDQQTMEVVVP